MSFHELKHRDFYAGKSVLVTGYTGFKGGWLARTLLLLGARVTGYSIEPDYLPNFNAVLKLSKDVISYSSSITDYTSLEKCIRAEKPEIIFHLAGQISSGFEDPVSVYNTNLMGTLNLMEAVRKSQSVKAVVVITTDKVYRNQDHIWSYRETDLLGGSDPYSSSKACVEIMVDAFRESFFRDNDTPAVATARAGNVLGGGDWFKNRIVPDIVKSLLEEERPVEIRRPNSIRPWQHVLPVTDGYLLLGMKLYKDKAGFSDSWNFAPESEGFITVKELTEKAIAVLGKGDYVIVKENHRPESKVLKLDPSKTKFLLGWTNDLPIDEALNLTFEWYKAYYSHKNMQDITDFQIKQFMKNDNKRKNTGTGRPILPGEQKRNSAQ